ncbi:2066_t:CDS:2, partial [Acaulospora colombiana]
SLFARGMRTIGWGWEEGLLETLNYGSDELWKLSDNFARFLSSLQLICFYETKKTSIFGVNTLLVNEQSASIHGVRRVSLDCDHSQMNKFAFWDDPNYIKVLQELKRIITQAFEEKPPSPEEENILKRLLSPAVESDSPHEECLKGTREDILAEIDAWTLDLNSPNILWIQGYPGAGKSVIASTFVSRLQRSGRLGSSFFFQREKDVLTTMNALWKKVAFDISRRYTSVRALVVAKLREVEHYSNRGDINTLFREIIHEPLENSGDIPIEKLPIVVIDALDECGGLEGAKSTQRTRLVRTLELWSKLPKRFKLIVTSRQEFDIRRVFQKTDHCPLDISVGHNESSFKDIKSFLEYRFTSITNQYTSLSDEEWPGLQIIDKLATKAAGLFIWAETVVKFIHQGDPKTRLNRILEGNNSGVVDLYSRILDTSLPSPDAETMQAFHAIVGT